MSHALHGIAAVLMFGGLIAAMFHADGRWLMSPHLIALGAMLDGLWIDRLMAPVYWFAVVTLVVIISAIGARLLPGSPDRVSRQSVLLGGCGSLLMCALMLADGHQTAAVVGESHHASDGASSLTALLLLASLLQGSACLYFSIRVALEMKSVVRAVEAGAMGASILVMALATLAAHSS